MCRTVEPMMESRAVACATRTALGGSRSVFPAPSRSTGLLEVSHGRDDPQDVPRPRRAQPRPPAPKIPEQQAVAPEPARSPSGDFVLRIMVDYCNGARHQLIVAR